MPGGKGSSRAKANDKGTGMNGRVAVTMRPFRRDRGMPHNGMVRQWLQELKGVSLLLSLFELLSKVEDRDLKKGQDGRDAGSPGSHTHLHPQWIVADDGTQLMSTSR